MEGWRERENERRCWGHWHDLIGERREHWWQQLGQHFSDVLSQANGSSR